MKRITVTDILESALQHLSMTSIYEGYFDIQITYDTINRLTKEPVTSTPFSNLWLLALYLTISLRLPKWRNKKYKKYN